MVTEEFTLILETEDYELFRENEAPDSNVAYIIWPVGAQMAVWNGATEAEGRKWIKEN